MKSFLDFKGMIFYLYQPKPSNRYEKTTIKPYPWDSISTSQLY
jgi:hypothetical protein